MDLSILIVSFNTRDLLKNCLDSIFRFTNGLIFEVIIVDNHSRDGSAEMIRKAFPQVKLHVNNINQGFARAVNKGIQLGSGDYFLVVNSDTLIIDNSIRLLWEFHKTRPDVGVLGPKLLNPDLSLFYSCRRFSSFLTRIWPLIPFLKSYLPKSLQLAIEDERFYSFPQEVDYFWGACFMFPRQLLLKLKGLDERFFLYAEEEDFCYRAKKQGWKVVYFPQAKVVHIGQGSSVNYVEQAYKQLFYSEYLFFKKHYGRLYALSFRFAVMGLMFFRIILYKLLALINRKSAGIYGRIEYGCRLIFKAYQPGEKSFFDTFSSS